MSETDSSLLERISKLSTDQSYQNMSRLKDKNSNFVNDLDEISPKNLNFSINSTENSIFEMLNQEIEKSLNPNNESEIKNDETLRDEARDFHLKNYWQNTNIAKITRILQDTFREQSDLKLQVFKNIFFLFI